MMCADVSVCVSDQVRRKNMMKKMTRVEVGASEDIWALQFNNMAEDYVHEK